MNRRANQIDLTKMLIYILKHLWLVVLCVELGFAARYMYTTRKLPDTYTAQGTMYVNNGNPNLSEDQYVNSGDLNSAIALIRTYLVVVKSDKVMGPVTEKLNVSHPGITAAQVSSGLTMESVSETGVVAVKSTTQDPQLSADIVNVVMEVAPDEIIRVVGAGNVEIMDYATVPVLPNNRNAIYAGIRNGASIGGIVAIAILAVLFLLNQKITEAQDLKDNYTPPVLASIKRIESGRASADSFILTNQSPMETIENYAKLRMNLFYTLVGKEKNAVVITSSISGEGKSTIACNLAISCGMSGKKVLLIDGDMRRATQNEIFTLGQHTDGLSDVLIGKCSWQNTIKKGIKENVDLMPAGHFPPNPAELLETKEMKAFLQEMEEVYDVILLDMPPINIVADPLVVSSSVAGCIFVTRQNFSDKRDIRKALIASEMTGMNVLGFVFYGEKINQGGYYSRRYYRSYYNKYDYRRRIPETPVETVATTPTTTTVSNDTVQDAPNQSDHVKSSYIKNPLTSSADRWKLRRRQRNHNGSPSAIQTSDYLSPIQSNATNNMENQSSGNSGHSSYLK